ASNMERKHRTVPACQQSKNGPQPRHDGGMPVIETLRDGLGILGIAVVVGGTGKPAEQIGDEQERGHKGYCSGACCDQTRSGYGADNQAHGAAPECAWKFARRSIRQGECIRSSRGVNWLWPLRP